MGVPLLGRLLVTPSFILLMSVWGVAGDIEGFVKFPGETPPPTLIANSLDPECPTAIAQTHLQVRQENRGLKNALVILDYSGDITVTKAKPIGLKAQGCTLSPRMQWTTLPSYLTLTNMDDIDQELFANVDGAQIFRVDLSGKGASVRRPLTRTGGLHEMLSENHPWTRAWVYTSAHPFVAVTDANGAFAMRNVPPGTYTIRAWHEGWQQKTKTRANRLTYEPMQEIRRVKVSKDGTATVYFEKLAPIL